MPAKLTALATALGEPVVSAGNRPIQLNDPQSVWFVERGAVDVFLVEHRDGKPVSSAEHLLRAETGRLVFGLAESGTQMVAVAKGVPGSVLRHMRLEDVQQQADGAELAAEVDAWVLEFAAEVARQIWPRPRIDAHLAGGESLAAEVGQTLSTRSGQVIWTAAAGAEYLGTEEPEPGGPGLMPLTSDSYLTITESGRVTGLSSRELNQQGRLLPALAEFHRLALGAERLNRMLLLADDVNNQTARSSRRLRDEAQAREGLFSVLAPSRAALDGESGSTLMAALGIIGKWEGIAFREPPRSQMRDEGEEIPLQDILDASQVRSRQVRLAAEDRWWLGDSGAMLGFRRADNSPVVLLPGRIGQYRAVDPSTGQSLRVDAARARELEQTAWNFYRPLPDVAPVGSADLLQTAGKSMGADLLRVIAVGLFDSLLLLAPAIAIGAIVDWVLPGASVNLLMQMTAVLVALALAGGLLQMLRGTAMMRIEGRFAARVSAAAWDRVLKLPQDFFRRYTAGDLGARMSVFQAMRDQVSGVVVSALLSSILLLPVMGLLFFYNASLAWMSLGIGLIALAITVALGLFQIAPQRQRFAASRRLSGDVYQFINGVNKLRAAGAERSAFAAWARTYRQQQSSVMQIGKLNGHLAAFSAAVPVLAGAALFAVMLYQGPGQSGLGDFLTVYAMSMVFFASINQLGISFYSISSILPGYEQMEPVLAEPMEKRAAGTELAELNGDVHFDRISFRYADDGPLILDDVSIRARPGEFIGLVGRSASGKSTLLRLGLGLEEPLTGTIYYDDRDLATLNQQSVRRQIGVVPQEGTLQPGTILDNIIGIGNDLTIDDAWRAARLAALDKDIRAMPMGMFTPVSDGSATFSGGQIQRIRIAAALVRNPRIVFLDEATSWLDTQSQQAVMQGIGRLAVTRIVVAHRLSTIRTADRIYVLEDGRVVQQGRFAELTATEGPFRELVQQQML